MSDRTQERRPAPISALEIYPLTSNRWRDFEMLFGERGASGGCWCMWWRLTQSQFTAQKGLSNKKAMRRIVESGEVPGLLAYASGQPAGWCAVAPRETYPRLERSRTLKRVDDESVWSVTCFFVAKPFRHQGVTLALLKAAIEYARAHGARIVEGYPLEPKRVTSPDSSVYTGLASTFRKAGFREVLRRSEIQPILRYYVE